MLFISPNFDFVHMFIDKCDNSKNDRKQTTILLMFINTNTETFIHT